MFVMQWGKSRVKIRQKRMDIAANLRLLTSYLAVCVIN